MKLSKRSIDLTGKKFGKLTMIEPIRKNKSHTIIWRAICECGNESEVRGYAATIGKTSSCGCIKGKDQKGLSGTPEYNSWISMQERCLNKNHPAFKRYGGRGIKICENG